MRRTTRIAGALLATCGLTFAAVAAAEEDGRRVRVIKRIVAPPGGPELVAGEGRPDVDVMITSIDVQDLLGAIEIPGHTSEIQAALARPAGALSTPDMLLLHSDELDLTEAQVEALSGLVLIMRKQHIRASAAAQLAEVDVQALADDPAPDLAALEEAFLEVARAQAAAHMLPFRLSREARDELDEAQLAKWDDLVRQRHDPKAMHEAHGGMTPGLPGAARDMRHDVDVEIHRSEDGERHDEDHD